MKYNKPHTRLKYQLGLSVALLTIILMYFFTAYIPKAFYANWAVLAVCVLICLSPFGHKKLVAEKDEKPRRKFMSWVLQIFALETALFAIFLGIIEVCSHTLPVLTSAQPNTAFQTNQFFFIHLGLFPWAIFALYAAGLGYISYCKNKSASMSQLLSLLFHHKPAGVLDVTLNVQARMATIGTISISFVFITLIIVKLITPSDMVFLTGFHIKTMIIIMALLLFGFTSAFRHILKKQLLQPKLPLFISLTSMTILIAVFIILINALFYHLGATTIHIPVIIAWLQEKNWMTVWLVFAACWWIGWTPVIAAHIARLSRGYRIRSMVIVSLLLPAIFSLSLYFFPGKLHHFLNHSHLFISFLAIAGFIYLLWRLTEKSVLPILIRSYLPARDEYKRRDHYFFFRKVFQVTLMMIYLYLPAGLTLLSVLLFFTVLSFSLQILLNVFASFMRLFTRQQVSPSP